MKFSILAAVFVAASLPLISSNAVEVVMGRRQELDKRTPVTLFNFLDDGAQRLEEVGNEAARAVASPDSGLTGELVSTRLALSQPGRVTRQISTDSSLQLLDLKSPLQPAEEMSIISPMSVQATRPTPQHAIIAVGQENDLNPLVAKAQIGSAFSAFKVFRPPDGSSKTSTPLAELDVPQQTSPPLLASEQHERSVDVEHANQDLQHPFSSTLKRPRSALNRKPRRMQVLIRQSKPWESPTPREPGDSTTPPPSRSNTTPQQSAASSSKDPSKRVRRPRTAKQKKRKNFLARMSYKKLKVDAANGDEDAEDKLERTRAKRREAYQNLPAELKEERKKQVRDDRHKLKQDADNPNPEIAGPAWAKLSSYRKYHRDKQRSYAQRALAGSDD